MKKLLIFLLSSAVLVGSFGFFGCDKGADEVNDYTSENPKPSLPADKDMQNVSAENVLKELTEYSGRLLKNGAGKYMAYSLYDIRYHYDDGDYTLLREESDVYSGMADGGERTGAFTYRNNRRNDDEYSKKVTAGIHKNSSLFRFASEETDKTEKTDFALEYFEDNSLWLKPDEYKIPSVYAVNLKTRVTAADRVKNRLNSAVLYETEKREHYLFEDVEIGEAATVDIKSFELVAKKSDKKFYASAKYTIEYLPSELIKNKATAVSEYSFLIDLEAPEDVSALPGGGVDIATLSLENLSEKICYPDISSAQLSQAVREGKDKTVEIAGGGDISKFSMYGTHGMFDVISVTDRKAVIDCAEIKAELDATAELPVNLTFNLTFYYLGDLEFEGKIFINR